MINLGFGVHLTGNHDRWPAQVYTAVARWYGVNMVPPAVFVSPGMWEPLRHAIAQAATLGEGRMIPVYVDSLIPLANTSTVYIRAHRNDMDTDTRYKLVTIHGQNT